MIACLFLQTWPGQTLYVSAAQLSTAHLSVPVFGPKDYVRRTSKPFSVTDQFSVAHPDGFFVLRVENGGQGRQY